MQCASTLRAGVPKERMQPQDMFVLDSAGNILETPAERAAPYKPPKLSECSPLFMAVRAPTLDEEHRSLPHRQLQQWRH